MANQILFALRPDNANLYAYRSFSGKEPLIYYKVEAPSRIADASAIGGYAIKISQTGSSFGVQSLTYNGRSNVNDDSGTALSALIRFRMPAGATGGYGLNFSLQSFPNLNESLSGFELRYYKNDGKFYALAADDEGYSILYTTSTQTITAGTWYDVVLTTTHTLGGANTYKVYLNASSIIDTALTDTGDPFSVNSKKYSAINLGKSGNTGCNMIIGEALLWNYIIDPTSVALVGGTGSLNGASRTAFVDAVAYDGLNSTDPGIANVRNLTSYYILGESKTGTCAVPGAADVRNGTAVDATTGTCNVPVAGDVRNGTAVDATTGTAYIPSAANTRFGINVDATTGTCKVPTAANTKIGVAVDVSDTGTYDGSDRWTDPGAANVKAPVGYKANSLTNNKTGSYNGTDTQDIVLGDGGGVNG